MALHVYIVDEDTNRATHVATDEVVEGHTAEEVGKMVQSSLEEVKTAHDVEERTRVLA